MKQEWYSVTFFSCVLAFIIGCIFSFFTLDLIMEQMDSVDHNQSYIDDKKRVKGKKQSFFENAKLVMGDDYLWWLFPT